MEIKGNIESVVSSMPLIEDQPQILPNLATTKPIDKKTVTNTVTKLSLIVSKTEVRKTFFIP